MKEINNQSEITKEEGLTLNDLIQWIERNKLTPNAPLLVFERAANLHKVIGIFANKNNDGKINAIILESDYPQVDWWDL